MGLFDHFPYTNVHELNLDWVLSMMKALEAEWEAFTAGNSLIFADPLQHDISKTYAKNTIVIDGAGNAYVSLQAVPVGVGLQNGDYWLMVFDYEAFIEKVNKNFTARYYRGSYRATAAMAIGDWLTVDDVLCKATAAIAVDDVLEVGVNIDHFTLEDFIKAFMQSANQLIQQYKNDIDASELLYRQQLAQDIANTTATLQAQLDAAISGATVDSEVINARVGDDGVTYPTLGDAIRTQFHNIKETIGNRDILIYPTNSGYYVNNNTGAIEAYAGWSVTNYIDISDLSAIIATFPIESLPYNGFYDANKNVISTFTIGDTETTIAVPPRAKYMVISNHIDRFNDIRMSGVPYDFDALENTICGRSIIPVITHNNYYVDSSNGNLVSYNGWGATDYIDLGDIQSIYAECTSAAQSYNAFYDSGYNFISAFTIPTSYSEIMVPPTAKYMRISALKNKYPDISVKLNYKKYPNQIPVIPATSGYYLDHDGTPTAYANWSISQKIPVKGIETIYGKFTHQALDYNCFFDENDNCLGYFKVYLEETEIHVPYNAAYMQISNHTAWFSDMIFMYKPYSNIVDNATLETAKVKGINRLGIKTNAPEQSIPAYKLAVQAGFKYLLADIRFTSDGVPVCIHDGTINDVARNMDGTVITDPVYVGSNTLATLNTYDYGIKAGAEYAGLGILTLRQFLQFCKNTDVQAYLEIKTGTNTSIKTLVDYIERFGMVNNVSVVSFATDSNDDPIMYADWVVNENPNIRVGLMTNGAGITATVGYKDHLVSLKTGHNSVFCFNWASETVTNDEVNWMADNRITFEVGNIDTEAAIISYVTTGNGYCCNGIESNLYDATTVLKNYALS